MTKKIAIVTGGNRGIGFEVARQLAKKGLQVILTARDEQKGQEAATKLKKEGLEVEFMPLDVRSPESAQALVKNVQHRFGQIDVLVNNAGVFLDSGWSNPGETSIFAAKPETVRNTLETNLIGPMVLSQLIAPIMKSKGYGRIVNVSSGMGQLAEMEGGFPAYRISKTAINALTRILSSELEGTGVLVNSMCPGWVKTDMGGQEAELTPQEGADTILWLATLPEGSPSGGFYRERQQIAW